MSSIEERNVTALERWMHEVFEEGNLDLAVELMAPSYVGHGPAGTVTHTPESYLAVIEMMRSNAPGERYEVHDLIARGTGSPFDNRPARRIRRRGSESIV